MGRRQGLRVCCDNRTQANPRVDAKQNRLCAEDSEDWEMNDWITYKECRPETEGVYEWRVPSLTVPDMIVLVAAYMRKRGAGYVDVLSPVFDYWDGYRVHVPEGLQWRPTREHGDVKWHAVKLIGVEGLEHADCIYCGKTPTLHALQRGSMGGVVVSDSPHRFNSWWLKCCGWGETPSLSDPREIERIRLEAFARAAEVAK